MYFSAVFQLEIFNNVLNKTQFCSATKYKLFRAFF